MKKETKEEANLGIKEQTELKYNFFTPISESQLKLTGKSSFVK